MLTQSNDISHEYCCTVVKIGEIIPIEGANTVAKTLVNGREIVISKDIKEGDLMIYASNECQLNSDFMSINNLYEDYTLNSNCEEVSLWIEAKSGSGSMVIDPEEWKEYKRTHCGYFDKHARVRMKKLCKTLSMGFLFEPKLLINWCPLLKDFDFSSMIDQDFDTVNKELFVQAYIPPIPESPHRASGEGKRNKHLAKFDRMIPGQFSFHYDTAQLERNIHRLNPDDWVTISVKLHGTSLIVGNILTKAPKWKGIYSKIFSYLPKFLQFTKKEYNIIYSSRTVIKNQFINPKVSSGFYNSDVWADYCNILSNYIPQGFTIYGEIVGYVSGSNSMIQKGYDYKCKPGENKLMIYRVTRQIDEGKVEYNVSDVKEWTLKLIDSMKEDGYPDFAARIHPIDILFNGQIKTLYNNDVMNHWHETLLELMKNDKEHFGMEENEPLCRNKTPREGIVLRIDNDPVNEAFKLKCLKFLGKEAESIDAGETSDIEMTERYG